MFVFDCFYDRCAVNLISTVSPPAGQSLQWVVTKNTFNQSDDTPQCDWFTVFLPVWKCNV